MGAAAASKRKPAGVDTPRFDLRRGSVGCGLARVTQRMSEEADTRASDDLIGLPGARSDLRNRRPHPPAHTSSARSSPTARVFAQLPADPAHLLNLIEGPHDAVTRRTLSSRRASPRPPLFSARRPPPIYLHGSNLIAPHSPSHHDRPRSSALLTSCEAAGVAVGSPFPFALRTRAPASA